MLSVFKKRKKFSKENLEYQCNVLSKNITVNDENEDVIISTLQQISELMIWGDQNDDTFFDVTAENRIFDKFLSIIKQQYNEYVTKQVLQTLSIIIQNMTNMRSLYHLFSNNYINELIVYNLEFTNTEILGYYIILLRQISSKLDKQTINFFFNSKTNDFPLYIMALKFFKNKNQTVRTTVMQIILNILKVCTFHKEVKHFISTECTLTVTYLYDLILFIKHDCLQLNQKFISGDNNLENALRSHLDHYYYLEDILSFDLQYLSQQLLDRFASDFIIPVLMNSLVAKEEEMKHDINDTQYINKRLSLFILTEMLVIFSNEKVKNIIIICLMDHQPQYKTKSNDLNARNIYKDTLFNILTTKLTQHKHEELMVCAVSLILRMVNNDTDTIANTLIQCGICPQSVSKHINKDIIKYPHEIVGCIINILARYSKLSVYAMRLLIELLIILVKDTDKAYNGLNETHYTALHIIWKSIQNDLSQYLFHDTTAKIYLIDIFEDEWNAMQQQLRINSLISNPKRIISSTNISKHVHKLKKIRLLIKNVQSLLYFLRIKNELLNESGAMLQLPFTARKDCQYYNHLQVPLLHVASGCLKCYIIYGKDEKRENIFFSTREPNWFLLFQRLPNHTGHCLIFMAIPIHTVQGIMKGTDEKMIQITITCAIAPHKIATAIPSLYNKKHKWMITLGFYTSDDATIALDYVTMNRLRVRRRMIHKLEEIMNASEDEKDEKHDDSETEVIYNV